MSIRAELKTVLLWASRFMGDLHLKVISKGKGSHPIATKLVDITAGCFDAIDKKYLKTLTVWFHQELDNPGEAIEAYVFRFDYCQDESEWFVHYIFCSYRIEKFAYDCI